MSRKERGEREGKRVKREKRGDSRSEKTLVECSMGQGRGQSVRDMAKHKALPAVQVSADTRMIHNTDI